MNNGIVEVNCVVCGRKFKKYKKKKRILRTGVRTYQTKTCSTKCSNALATKQRNEIGKKWRLKQKQNGTNTKHNRSNKTNKR